MVVIIHFLPVFTYAQVEDTFFLAKKKGVLGRIGRSISTGSTDIEPVRIDNPFIKFAGKKIASIEIVALGLNRNINDTNELKKNFLLRIADKFHKNTREAVIRKNLFFREGDLLVPLMLSDNEIYLRDQVFLQDALIIALKNFIDSNEVDVIVITRDVFSIGGTVSMNSFNQAAVELKEENVGGSGSKIAILGLYDKFRNPTAGFGAEYIKRNINGNFLNWKVGYNNFNNSYSSQRKEETRIYSSIERPLVSRYTRWTGLIEWEYNLSANTYSDNKFDSVYKYRYVRTDIWGGYNIGAGKEKLSDNINRLRSFVALRTLYTHFYSKPLIYRQTFNYNYADINGVLFAYNLYKQNFYRANFIYGFGRFESIPEGLHIAATVGWTNKDGKKRNYYGLSGEAEKYTKKGKFYSFNIRVGAFSYSNYLEDIDLLMSIDHFTGLMKMGTHWRNRNFFNIAVTRQYKHFLSPPLFLQSDFGLPYYHNGFVEGNFRSAVKGESVFFNLRKVLGFRFAPFVFAGSSFITPVGQPLTKSKAYTAFGGGFRTRNENLVLGTIEVRSYFFLKKTFPEMKSWKIDISTNIKFKNNNNFIQRPDFVNTNK
ncbi:MAG: hypothetical protein WKF35_13195 [Ferruginibacter sp.]